MSLNVPVVTGYSGFWSNTMSPTQPQGGVYSMSQDKSRAKMAYHIARLFNKGSMRDARAALAALIGTAAGSNANSAFYQRPVPGSTNTTIPGVTGFGDFGGVKTATSYSTINRNTTSADVTELKKWFAQGLLESGITYPAILGNSLASGKMQAGGTGRF